MGGSTLSSKAVFSLPETRYALYDVPFIARRLFPVRPRPNQPREAAAGIAATYGNPGVPGFAEASGYAP